MATKRKISHAKKSVRQVAQAAPEVVSPPAEEPERPAGPTHVVEVVEDQPAVSTSVPVVATDQSPHVTPEESTLVEPIAAEASLTPPESPGEEKQKEVISELFAKPETENPLGFPDISEHKKSSSKSLLVWAGVVLVATSLVGGGLILGLKYPQKLSALFAVKPTPTPQAPTPSPTSAVPKRGDITIEVLNGGGKAGAGSKMKAFLEEKGYTVTAVGNTEDYTYKKTEIRVKASKQQYLSLLETDLKESYVIGTASAALSSDASTDARVIVGKE